MHRRQDLPSSTNCQLSTEKGIVEQIMTGFIVLIEPAELPGASPLPPYLFSFADQHLHVVPAAW